MLQSQPGTSPTVSLSPFDDPSHAGRVDAVARALAARAAERASLHIDKGGVHHFVPRPGDTRFTGRAVDLRALNHILTIDIVGKRAWAEPGITFAELVKETLKVGLVPMTVPELTGITIGGAVAGCSVESMSFRYGGFHDSCFEYEALTTTGERVRCSPQQEPELFEALHGSYGTLGILTGIGFRLVDAKPFVRIDYLRYPDGETCALAMKQLCLAGDFHFIDGIVHSPTEYVLCVGRFVDKPPYVSDYTGEHIYYKSTRHRKEDFLSTYDYFFRYDTECHWLTRTVPPLEWGWVRKTIGKPFLGSTNLITWSRRLEKILALQKRPDVVVDVFIPHNRMGEFFSWYESAFDYWPLWLVPYRMNKKYGWINPQHAAQMNDDLFVDCAIYGKRNGKRDVDYSQLLEQKTYELAGIKTLISENHHSREQFWTIFNQPAYDAAKQRMDPNGLQPNVYDKFHRA